MAIYGFDDEMEQEQAQATERKAAVEVIPKRQPFAFWQVGSTTYRLKLTTAQVCRLEDKYRTNLLTLLTGANGIPPLSVMLTVVLAAATPWNHGVKFTSIQEAFDRYTEDGGTQLTLFTDVVMQILTVSGFFTEDQAENMSQKLNEVREVL
ncbi:DUF6096 family protein [Enterocloster alcoholdehydrogenati]|uniref:DUF6096 family protein n=1 Tax=Enterocloster alcoholdehydrogenati TaxID=2547410 RepID=UPI0015932736|nr:DUF6096 family protein [Enterocloster alcoholdehydrogenati]